MTTIICIAVLFVPLAFTLYEIWTADLSESIVRVADYSVDEDAVLFAHVQYEYSDEIDSFLYAVHTLDNSGNMTLSTSIFANNTDMSNNMLDPIFVLAYANGITEENTYTTTTSDISTVKSMNDKLWSIEDFESTEINIADEDSNTEGSYIFAYMYSPQDVAPITLYFADGEIRFLSDNNAISLLEDLFDTFK